MAAIGSGGAGQQFGHSHQVTFRRIDYLPRQVDVKSAQDTLYRQHQASAMNVNSDHTDQFAFEREDWRATYGRIARIHLFGLSGLSGLPVSDSNEALLVRRNQLTRLNPRMSIGHQETLAGQCAWREHAGEFQ